MDAHTVWLLILSVAVAAIATFAIRAHERERARARKVFTLAKATREFALDAARRAAALQLAEARRARGVVSGLEPRFRAEHGEDLVLWELFGDQPSGRFLEIGAHDGLFCSVSYAFESAGWTGVLIEASPGPAERCRENRPNSTVTHAAVVAPGAPETVGLRIITEAQRSEEPALLSHVESEDDKLDAVRGYKTSSQRVEVPAMTMDAILDRIHGGDGDRSGTGTMLDFAVIDVEGHERALFEGWNTDRHPARVLVVEEFGGPAVGDMRQELASRGYALAGRYFLNNVYVRTDEAELLAKARRVLERWRIW